VRAGADLGLHAGHPRHALVAALEDDHELAAAHDAEEERLCVRTSSSSTIREGSCDSWVRGQHPGDLQRRSRSD
jgi:hypothetical protein